ncbi:MAG: DUF4282 domain-containing protein [Robiginitomaculum sp.]|nr:DUF4282 domain-containing protein [Robiginitomaculum sp.]
MDNNETRPNFIAAFFGFKRMVSPFFISIVYFLGLIVILASTGGALLKGPVDIFAQAGLDLEGMMVWAGYAGLVLIGFGGILIWRFYCEMFIVLFSIFNRLSDIKSALQSRS